MRRLRAQKLTASIIHELSPILEECERLNGIVRQEHPDLCSDVADMAFRRAHDVIFKLMYESGVDVVTDCDRADLGLPARDHDGWTHEELLALEQRRLDLLRQPIPQLIVTTETE